MITMEFHFRPSVRLKGSEGKIFLRIIYQRQSGSITFPYRIFSEEWNKEKREVVPVSDDPKRITYLSKVESTLKREKRILLSIVDELCNQGKFSVKDILSLYRFRYQQEGLSTLVMQLCKELTAAGQERTARAYCTSFRRLLQFVGKSDLAPEELTGCLINRYEKHLREEKKSLNTISFYMRNLRAIYNKGIRRHYFSGMTENPFADAYTRVASTRKRALSLQDINKLEKMLEAPDCKLTEKEQKALSLFLFAFYTRGMSFVDLANLRKKDVGKTSISYYRRKTGKYMEIGLTTNIKKYMQSAVSDKDSPFLFDLLNPQSDSLYRQYCCELQKQNHYLKQVAQKAGIKDILTTHMARHSWATVAKKAQIPISVICEALGHSAITTTYNYLDSFGISVLDQANRKVAQAVRRVN